MQHSAMLDCAKKRVLAECPGQGLCIIQGVRLGEPKLMIFVVKAYQALAKGCVGYLASVVAFSSLALRIQDIPVVCEYADVFLEDLLFLLFSHSSWSQPVALRMYNGCSHHEN